MNWLASHGLTGLSPGAQIAHPADEGAGLRPQQRQDTREVIVEVLDFFRIQGWPSVPAAVAFAAAAEGAFEPSAYEIEHLQGHSLSPRILQ